MDRNRLSWIRKRLPLSLALGVVSWGGGGCEQSTGPELSTVVVYLTDEPSDMLETAEVWISRIYLQGGPDEVAEGEEEEAPVGRVDLFDAGGDPEARQVFDLLQLQNGVMADVTGEVDIEAGSYSQLRFVVDSTWVTLADGYQFENGETAAGFKVPSGARSGIKVQLLEGMIEAGEGDVVTIVVDFPVDHNFVIQTGDDPMVIRQVIFTPLLKEIDPGSEES